MGLQYLLLLPHLDSRISTDKVNKISPPIPRRPRLNLHPEHLPLPRRRQLRHVGIPNRPIRQARRPILLPRLHPVLRQLLRVHAPPLTSYLPNPLLLCHGYVGYGDLCACCAWLLRCIPSSDPGLPVDEEAELLCPEHRVHNDSDNMDGPPYRIFRVLLRMGLLVLLLLRYPHPIPSGAGGIQATIHVHVWYVKLSASYACLLDIFYYRILCRIGS